MTVLGTNVRRADGEAKVRGTAVYGFDVADVGMLHGAFVRSPVPAGRLVSIDATRALAMAEVRAVFTADDAPQLCGGWLLKDHRLFARGDVRFVGEAIALVVAEDERTARLAAAEVDVVIDPLEAVLDVESALDETTRHVHPEWESFVSIAPAPRGGNLAWEARLETGDVEAAFARADRVFEDEFHAPRQHQSSIEPHVAVARYDNGRFTVQTPAQYPFLVRDRVAEILGVPVTAVRVLVPHIGGGFGGKIDALLEPYACLAARATGRPVRVANRRQEEFAVAGPRESAIVRLRTAVSADGTILGQEADILVDNGAASGETVAIVSVAPLALGGTYRIPAARYSCKAVYTNTLGTSAYRGIAGPYCVFSQERHLDRIANALGIDRRELRLRNVLRKGEKMVNGQVLEDAGFIEAFEAIEEIAPWNGGKRHSTNGRLRGVGLAAVSWLTNPGPGNATVTLREDGAVTVVSGCAEIGTGALVTGVRQIVAEELGIPVEHVSLLAADTDAAGYDAGAQGSRSMFAVGSAAREASQSVRAQVLETASGLLEASADDLEIVGGEVGVVGVPARRMPLAAVAQAALWTTGPIAATGKHIAPPVSFDEGCVVGALFTAFAGASYSVHMAEVEVDPETGHVDVVRYVVAQDVGRAINPQMIEGQIHGGVLQGIGYALFEDLRIYDGRVTDDSLERYRLPTALDAPPIESILLELPCPYGPFGAKGAAEPPVVPVAAAVVNAIADAIERPINAVPVTPFRVLELLAGQPDQVLAQPKETR
jgi:CO/xanthine dehydrogenase Mo-binding subunit